MTSVTLDFNLWTLGSRRPGFAARGVAPVIGRARATRYTQGCSPLQSLYRQLIVVPVVIPRTIPRCY